MKGTRRARQRKHAKRMKAMKYSLMAVACLAVLSLGVFVYRNQETLFMLPGGTYDAKASAEMTQPSATPDESAAPDETPEGTAELSTSATPLGTEAPEEKQPSASPAPTDAPIAEPDPASTQEAPAADEIIPANPARTSDETSAILKGAEGLADDPGDALRLAGIKIGIDPGHQGKGNNEQEPVSPGSSETKAKVSSGTAGVKTRIAEHVTNLEISLKLRDALVAEGAEVYMTRETADVDISNVERAQMMNELKVDLVLRLHCNGSTNQSANGIGLYVRATGTNAEECLRAAEALLPEMVAATGAREDGIFKRDTYSGLNWSDVPSILVEMGFMSNAEEDVLLNTPEYQDKLVEGMVEGIAAYCLTPAPME